MERLPSAAAPPERSFSSVTGTSGSDVNECSRRNLGVATADVRRDERPCLVWAERSSNLSGSSPREGPPSREGGKNNPLQGVSAEYVSLCDSKLGLESSYYEYNYTGSCSSLLESGASLKPCSTVAYHRTSASVFRPLSDRTTSGVDQLLEMVARSATQLYRRPIGLVLEIVVPLLFIATTIALWGIWGDTPHPEASFVSPPKTTVGMLPAPETIGACWNEKAYADRIGSLPPCSTVSYPYTCDGDMTATPFPPESICRNDAVLFADMTLAYLTSLVGHLSRVPSLDTIITFQMLAQMQLKPLTELGAMAVSNLHPVMSFNAIIASGKVYIVGQLDFTRKLIEHMNAESSLFSFFNDGNVYASVDEVWSAVPAGSMVWAIVELRSSSVQGLDMVLHMNNSALPSLGTTDDLTYPGGVLNDTAEVYIASGFLTLQQTVTEFYLSYYGLYTTSQTQFLTSFPHPEYFRTPLLMRSRELLSFVFGVAFLYSVSQQVKRIVLEKELRIREAMLIMGLRQWAIYVSEFVVQLAIFVPTCVLCVVMLKLTYVTKSDPLILFLIFFLFALTTIPLRCLLQQVAPGVACDAGDLLYLGDPDVCHDQHVWLDRDVALAALADRVCCGAERLPAARVWERVRRSADDVESPQPDTGGCAWDAVGGLLHLLRADALPRRCCAEEMGHAKTPALLHYGPGAVVLQLQAPAPRGRRRRPRRGWRVRDVRLLEGLRVV
ncbi:ABC-2 family transporter protein, putative [Leishmania lindenbergi]|uniref:ABC-2 family transporter protein/ABC transporter n=1 Tax=Leishmania lindenbergi TaxID=651832 RepID=A0AAW3AU98_9TRYP